MVKKKDAASKAVRQAEMSVRAVRAHAKKLLSRAQLDVREYRRELKNLKKQQIVSKRINAATHQPTRYMIRKIKKFKGVAVGHELAIAVKKMSPHRARLYSEKGLARIVDGFLLRPKTAAKQKIKVHKDHIQITTELQRGQEDVIPLPTRLEDMHDILNWLYENEQMVNELKGPKGQLGFQLAGHNSRVGLANVKELTKYLQKYDGSDPRLRGNIFNGHSRQIASEFVIIRFRPAKGGKAQPTMDPFYGVKRYSKGRRKDRKDERRGDDYRRKRERERKARQRMAEDKDQHKARLAKQRQRDRERSNERREKRMAKRLIGE